MMNEEQKYQIRFCIGDVLLLNCAGTADASFEEMCERCEGIIKRECDKLRIEVPKLQELPSYLRGSASEEIRNWFIQEIKKM